MIPKENSVDGLEKDGFELALETFNAPLFAVLCVDGGMPNVKVMVVGGKTIPFPKLFG